MRVGRGVPFTLILSLTLGGVPAVFGHGEVVEVGSSAPGSDALRLGAFDFAEKGRRCAERSGRHAHPLHIDLPELSVHR